MRSFAAILLRRLAFRPITGRPGLAVSTVIYDYLSEGTRKDVETMLLDCVANETDDSVRSKILDTVTEFAEGSIHRGRTCCPFPCMSDPNLKAPNSGPWPELQAFAAQYTVSPEPLHRTIAYQIFSRIPRLLLDQELEEVSGALQQGLASEQEPTRLAALEASVAFLMATDKAWRDRAAALMTPMLNVSDYSLLQSFEFRH